MNFEEILKKKVSAISLGCDKNRVDLEKMLYNVSNAGFELTPDITDAEIIIINTCAFIKPAIKETLDNIKVAASLKGNNKCEKVIVTGCYVSRFSDKLPKIKGVDIFLNIKDNKSIVETIFMLYGINAQYDYREGRVLSNLPHYAYLKIADGCDNFCTYCTIPKIRGRYQSVPMDCLVNEAKILAQNGVKELILVAQDTTRYGQDLYGEYKLVELIKNLSKIEGIQWIRLHYCYPELVSDALLEEIHNNSKVCKYIDIPFQHIDNQILKKMNRRTSEDQIRSLVEKINTKYPEINIRTTFIVGFPGERKEQFNKLLDFLKWAELSHAGFFKYSKEDGTPAAIMENQVSAKSKEYRLKKAQEVQYNIAYKKNNKICGKIVEVIVDEYDETSNIYFGRMATDTPDSDYITEISSGFALNIGQIYKVKIYEFSDTFFKGEAVQ